MNPNERLGRVEDHVSNLQQWTEQTRIELARQQQRLAGIKYVEWFPQISSPATTFTIQTGAGAVDSGYWLDLRVLAFKLSANDSVACYKGENAAGRLFAYGPPPGGGPNPAPATPAVPGSTTAVQNPNTFPVTVVITGGTMTAVIVNGITVGTGAGTYIVPAAGSISMTYTVAPTWAWTNANAANTAQNLVTIDLSKDVLWKGEPLFFTTSGTGNIASLYITGWQVPAEEQGKLY